MDGPQVANLSVADFKLLGVGTPTQAVSPGGSEQIQTSVASMVASTYTGGPLSGPASPGPLTPGEIQHGWDICKSLQLC